MAQAGPRYGTKTRIGNWAEDESARDLAAKDYEARRSRGELLHLRKAREKAFLTQPVPHTFTEDGLVHYGDHIQLQITPSGAAAGSRPQAYALSCNVFDQVAPGRIRVSASSAAIGAAPQARNVFIVEPSGGLSEASVGEPVRFGDRIALACDPALTVDLATKVVGLQFLLHSQRANNIIGAGKRGLQEADMAVHRSAETEWVVTAPSGDALASIGEAVRSGEPIVLQHAMSNAALAADAAVTCEGDLGTELEAHVNSYRAARHVSMTHGGELPPAAALPQNCWAFVHSADRELSADPRGFRALTPETLMERARAMIARACGPHGLRSLGLALSALDQRATGLLPAAAIKVALFEHGVAQSDEEFRLLLAPVIDATAAAGGAGGGAGSFGVSLGRSSSLGRSGGFGASGGAGGGAGGVPGAGAPGGGLIDIRLLMGALRAGNYTAGRRELVQAAFEHLERQKAAGRLPVQPYLRGVAAPGLAGLTERTGVHDPLAASHGPKGGAASLSATAAGRAAAGGGLTIADVKNAFDAKFEPRAALTATGAAGSMTPVEAAFEFSRQWPSHHRPGDAVSAPHFHAYYEDVSALIGDDHAFADMVANTWHVPGRGTWKTKASKRVSVTFHKGTTTEVVIPEAEDIPDDDLEGLAAALKKLGFGGIARVKVLEMIECE